jgi:hypothetical protein
MGYDRIEDRRGVEESVWKGYGNAIRVRRRKVRGEYRVERGEGMGWDKMG